MINQHEELSVTNVKKDPSTRVSEVVGGWGKVRPEKKLFGLTRDEYLLQIKPRAPR